MSFLCFVFISQIGFVGDKIHIWCLGILSWWLVVSSWNWWENACRRSSQMGRKTCWTSCDLFWRESTEFVSYLARFGLFQRRVLTGVSCSNRDTFDRGVLLAWKWTRRAHFAVWLDLTRFFVGRSVLLESVTLICRAVATTTFLAVTLIQKFGVGRLAVAF